MGPSSSPYMSPFAEMPEKPENTSIREELSSEQFRFATEQYTVFSQRVTELQKEREVWVRHSIVATFAVFGWIAVYRDDISSSFMLDMLHVRAIFLIPIVFNLGGALRFFFIQRDINRLVHYLTDMERDVLKLPDRLCDAPSGRGIRDRHWHPPSVAYWLFIVATSIIASVILA